MVNLHPYGAVVHEVRAMSSHVWTEDLSGVRIERDFWKGWMARQMADAPRGVRGGYQSSSVWRYVVRPGCANTTPTPDF